METIIPFIIPALVAFCVYLRKMERRKEEEEELEDKYRNNHYDEAVNSIYESARESAEQTHQHIEDSMKNEQNQPDTLGLMFRTLSNLGCQPTKNEDGTLSVSYQGENFHMEFGGMYARVWDPMWAGVKADDTQLPQIREAVNAANFNFGPTVVMTKPDEEGVIRFHSRRDIMLHPACPDNEPFVKSVLDSFFDAKEQVRSNFQHIIAQQNEVRRNRRPVGFTTGFTNSENTDDKTSTES